MHKITPVILSLIFYINFTQPIDNALLLWYNKYVRYRDRNGFWAVIRNEVMKMANNTLNFRPLKASEVECRVQSINQYYATVLLYKDARVDMNLLNETVGSLNWKREHTRDNANCIVSIWDENKNQWVSKEDTGTESNTEAAKGLASDSFKRACVNWGIGIELYSTPLVKVKTDFLEVKQNQRGNATTYDTFKVKTMNVETDNNIKRIVELEIELEHKGMREVVWRWKEGSDPEVICPSWVKQRNAQNVYGGNPPQQNNQQNNQRNGGYNNQQGGYQNAPQQNYQQQNGGYQQGGYNNQNGYNNGQQNGGYNNQQGGMNGNRQWQ